MIIILGLMILITMGFLEKPETLNPYESSSPLKNNNREFIGTIKSVTHTEKTTTLTVETTYQVKVVAMNPGLDVKEGEQIKVEGTLTSQQGLEKDFKKGDFENRKNSEKVNAKTKKTVFANKIETLQKVTPTIQKVTPKAARRD